MPVFDMLQTDIVQDDGARLIKAQRAGYLRRDTAHGPPVVGVILADLPVLREVQPPAVGLRPFTGADMLQGKVFELVRRAVVGRLEQYLPRPVVAPQTFPEYAISSPRLVRCPDDPSLEGPSFEGWPGTSQSEERPRLARPGAQRFLLGERVPV